MIPKAPAGHGAQGEPATGSAAARHETPGRFDSTVELAPIEWGKLLPDVARFSGQVFGLYLREPENLAGIAGAVTLPTLVFRRHVPFLPFLLMAFVGDQMARMAYRASRDLHDLAEAARAGD